jgi:hypothetical protein
MNAWMQFDFFDSAHMEERCAPFGRVSLSDLLIKGAKALSLSFPLDGDTLRENAITEMDLGCQCSCCS